LVPYKPARKPRHPLRSLPGHCGFSESDGEHPGIACRESGSTDGAADKTGHALGNRVLANGFEVVLIAPGER
jgi:hypothetical protein